MVESFAWREIGSIKVGPRLLPPGQSSHAFSARTLTPEFGCHLPKMSFRERALLARGTG